METKPNGNAYPIQYRETSNPFDSEPGLTKREYFAAMALQGWVASYAESRPDEKLAAEFAVELADALINALNEK